MRLLPTTGSDLCVLADSLGVTLTNVVKHQACLGPLRALCVALGFKCLDFNSILQSLYVQSPFYVSFWISVTLVAGSCKVCSCQYV